MQQTRPLALSKLAARRAAGDEGLSMPSLLALRGELAAVASLALSLPMRFWASRDAFDPGAPHPTPVVLVHGLLGDRTNFLGLRRALVRRGIRNFASFSYAPRIDYQRLAPRLGRAIDAVCRETGVPQVDVIGHSLGGLVARYLIDTRRGAPIRRLVTLGAPHYTDRLPAEELAIFAAHDPLVPPPHPLHGPRGRATVIPDCGHLGLLRHETVVELAAGFLTAAADPAHERTARRAA